MNALWKRLAGSLRKTRGVFAEGLAEVFTQRSELDEEFYERLEEVLLAADVGLETAEEILSRLRDAIRREGVRETEAARAQLRQVVVDVLRHGWQPPVEPEPNAAPHVVLVVGVNGVGKTTSIGKLAWHYHRQGRRPLVVASETYRAAALEQLGVWAERANAELIRSQPGADPAAVAFDGVRAAHSRGADVVLIDTAGRIQTNVNLMEELRKIRRVVAKAQPEAPHESLLVLDATVGQNGLSQARQFADAAEVSGIFLAKLDGSARGGVILAIAHALGIPVRYVGLGEQIDALAEFDPEPFAEALLEPIGAAP
ncbi:MAG: signal recognition particle-docking protein FtsY [Candidatus Eisenbacteria bacterium]|nr:signal recognition particle-docking protein FtsY [Candidatus Eisenbacteria bacterium]